MTVSPTGTASVTVDSSERNQRTIIIASCKKNPKEARENLRQATQMANKIHNPNEKNEHMAMIGEAFIEARCYEEAQRTLGKYRFHRRPSPFPHKLCHDSWSMRRNPSEGKRLL